LLLLSLVAKRISIIADIKILWHVPMILTTDSYTVASFPGSCGGGGKRRAWYTLFVDTTL